MAIAVARAACELFEYPAKRPPNRGIKDGRPRRQANNYPAPRATLVCNGLLCGSGGSVGVCFYTDTEYLRNVAGEACELPQYQQWE